jgi:pyruvate/2-oxoglutarate dehydrogenase complex dihydrolipoamide dehydrogenase (E3) component
MADENDTYTVAVIGGGSAAEALMRELADTDHRMVVFEPNLLGGECPFLACMPSKAMLHDRAVGRTWTEAVERRDEIVDHLDDEAHVAEARELGVTIVRERARIVGPGRVEADGTTYRVEHVVVATGAESVMPELPGLDPTHDRVWTSDDALTAQERPASVVMIGGGVIGSELAFMFSGFDVAVTTLDASARPAADLHPRVSELIVQTLRRAGVQVVNDIEVVRVELSDESATVHLADGATHTAERVLVAVGRSPRRSGIGLESLGIDPADVRTDGAGRLISDADHDVWFVGDAAGRNQYTHVANHHAAVVADHLAGTGERKFDDVVVPACIFIDPPVMVIGATWADLTGDDDVVWAELDLDTPRSITDEHGDGFITVAARRSTGCLVAAHGIGAHFDEIVHALVVAIDGEVPVDRLVHTIQPFPTVGEILGQVYAALAAALEG